jgi:hypothetical protein
MGEVVTLVPNLVVVNQAIAIVKEASKVKGIATGNTLIISSHLGLSDTVNLNVVSDSSALASLSLSPDTAEVVLNAPFSFNVLGRDLLGRSVAVSNVNFNANPSNLGTLNTTGSPSFTGTAWGTTRITATANGVASNPLDIAIVRKGSFRGLAGYSGRGTVVAKVKNGQLVLRFDADFLSQGAPDLRVYLSNTGTGNMAVANNGIEVALLRNLQGRQSYVVPASVNISTYNHCVIYCRQFSVAILTASLQ